MNADKINGLLASELEALKNAPTIRLMLLWCFMGDLI